MIIKTISKTDAIITSSTSKNICLTVSCQNGAIDVYRVYRIKCDFLQLL